MSRRVSSLNSRDSSDPIAKWTCVDPEADDDDEDAPAAAGGRDVGGVQSAAERRAPRRPVYDMFGRDYEPGEEDFDQDTIEYLCSCCQEPPPEMHVSTSLGRKSKLITCPNCRSMVWTFLTRGYKARAHAFASLLAPVCLCWVVYVFPCCHTVRHYCPMCRVFLGAVPGGLMRRRHREPPPPAS